MTFEEEYELRARTIGMVKLNVLPVSLEVNLLPVALDWN